MILANLTGPDVGPKSKIAYSNWDKKVISIPSNQMSIEFRSDDSMEYKGFSANIYFTPIPNKECESWLQMNERVFQSPNYPLTYHNTKKCHWLITVDHDSQITLDLFEFYVQVAIDLHSDSSNKEVSTQLFVPVKCIKICHISCVRKPM